MSLNSWELVFLGDLRRDSHLRTTAAESWWCRVTVLLSWLLLAWHPCQESFLHFPSTKMAFHPWSTMEEGIWLGHMLSIFSWACHALRPLTEMCPSLGPGAASVYGYLLGLAALAGQPVGQGDVRDGVEMQTITDVSLHRHWNERISLALLR